jgi:hypothetical protein
LYQRSRSKDDVPPGRELMASVFHPELLSKITAIMVYLHQGPKAYKKLKKKEKMEKDDKKKKFSTSVGSLIPENVPSAFLCLRSLSERLLPG